MCVVCIVRTTSSQRSHFLRAISARDIACRVIRKPVHKVLKIVGNSNPSRYDGVRFSASMCFTAQRGQRDTVCKTTRKKHGDCSAKRKRAASHWDLAIKGRSLALRVRILQASPVRNRHQQTWEDDTGGWEMHRGTSRHLSDISQASSRLAAGGGSWVPLRGNRRTPFSWHPS